MAGDMKERLFLEVLEGTRNLWLRRAFHHREYARFDSTENKKDKARRMTESGVWDDAANELHELVRRLKGLS